MTTLTPTTQPITVTADMRAELTRQYPADEARIDRAVPMVQAGLVERTARPDVWLVRSASEEDRDYTVWGRSCSCADYKRRGACCKHYYAVQLFQQAERLDAEQADPTLDADAEQAGSNDRYQWHVCERCGASGTRCSATCPCEWCRIERIAERAQADPAPLTIHVDPEDEAIPYTLGLRGRLGGEPCDLPPRCSRCHAEAAILAHPDRLGRVCLLAETFGEGV